MNDPHDLDEELARLLAAHRKVRRPPPHLRAQIASAIARTPITAPTPPPRTLRPTTNGAPNGVARWLGGMAVGGAAAAAIILLVRAVLIGSLSSSPQGPTTEPNAAPAVRSKDDAKPTTPRAPVSSAAPKTTPAAAPITATPASPTAPATVRGSTTTPRAAGPADQDNREIRLLREAEVAISRDPTEAQRLLRRHHEEFPNTTLSLERDALTILAACARAPTADTRRQRDDFLRSHPRSPYTARVRAACTPPAPQRPQ